MTRRLTAAGMWLRGNRMRRASRTIAAVAVGAVVASTMTAVLVPVSAQAVPVAASQSMSGGALNAAAGILPMRFATGGAGQYQGAIDWFEWGTQGQVLPASGMTRTETREVPGGTLATTCTVGAPAGGQVVVQRPGTFTGDGLDDLYNIGGTGANNQLAIGLGNFGTADVSFSFNCSVTLNGTAVPLAGLVMADAEASLQPTEWLQATIPAGANWRMIDRFRSSECTENGSVIRTGQTLRFAGVPTGCTTFPTGVAFMEGASSANVALHSGTAPNIGRTAVALGVVLFSDFGDAPASYGDAGSLYSPNFAGPAVPQGSSALFGPALSTAGQPAVRLGAAVTPEQGSQPSSAASSDGADDGVRFNTDVSVPGRNETVWVNASAAGFLNAWIDFNSNGTFDQGERIADDTPVVAGANQITYVVPEGDEFVPGTSFARFRISAGAGQVTGPTGVVTNGEVEDYTRELFDAPGEALELCVDGTEPVPVSLIQNPSFENRTGNFANTSAASTIGYAEHWSDSHPSGGQYHVFAPDFDSGPAAGTQPVRAGAEGYGFEGGHSATLGGVPVGEGAVNVLTAALDPDATYVGFFSMAAGGYSRQGDGFMQFFGTNDLATGSYPHPAVTPQTPANTELLYTTPVVEYAGIGVRPTWELNTFQLDASQAWPYLRVEVRNAVPANDATVAGQVWMNFDDFHMYECAPIQDFGDAPASYGTSLQDDGPRHLLPGYGADATTASLMLGALVDEEEDGFASDDARGDDEDAAADEDGVSGPIVVSPRGESTVTVTATNDTDAAATLAGWIDLDGNGAFDAGELVTVPVPAASGTAEYAVTFPAATTTSETYARFRLFPAGVTEFLPTG
ncbi:CshA/CshB family fibrillar adhesin-related protein, partial [Microbacterium sp.]|uniref:CshA/CshB family fibrillar adhesin-related protein n=1 Tax=Microbacterium sp. TaxID=51671 RepID=UPI002811D7BF